MTYALYRRGPNGSPSGDALVESDSPRDILAFPRDHAVCYVVLIDGEPIHFEAFLIKLSEHTDPRPPAMRYKPLSN
jgi:hypothetical protein